MKNLRFKYVGRYDNECKLLRVFRIMWEKGIPGDGKGFSTKLSLGLCLPWQFLWKTEYTGTIVRFLGLRLHLAKSYGGIFG